MLEYGKLEKISGLVRGPGRDLRERGQAGGWVAGGSGRAPLV